MKHYEASSLVNASPDAIWAVLVDASGYSRWDSGVVRVEGRIAVGEKLKVTSEVNPKRAFAITVTEMDPGRRMTWTGGMPLGLFKGVRTYTLVPQGDGMTKFTMREEFTGPMLPMIWKSMPDIGAVVREVRIRPQEAGGGRLGPSRPALGLRRAGVDRAQPLDQAKHRRAGLDARCLDVLGARYVHSGFVEGAVKHVCERLDRLGLDRSLVDGLGQRGSDYPQAVPLTDLAPLLPTEDGRTVEQDDALVGRVQTRVEESVYPSYHSRPHVRLLERPSCNRVRHAAVDLFQHGSEEILLSREVVIQGAARDAAAPDDLLRRRIGIASLGKESTRCLHEPPPGRLRVLLAPASLLHPTHVTCGPRRSWGRG